MRTPIVANIVLAGLVCAAALASCGSASTTTSTTNSATVTGRVLVGPTCPVEQAGHPCPPRLVAATATARDTKDRLVTSTQSGRDGTYQLRVPSGTYTLNAETPQHPYPVACR
jgi:hypothetical protein